MTTALVSQPVQTIPHDELVLRGRMANGLAIFENKDIIESEVHKIICRVAFVAIASFAAAFAASTYGLPVVVTILIGGLAAGSVCFIALAIFGKLFINRMQETWRPIFEEGVKGNFKQANESIIKILDPERTHFHFKDYQKAEITTEDLQKKLLLSRTLIPSHFIAHDVRTDFLNLFADMQLYALRNQERMERNPAREELYANVDKVKFWKNKAKTEFTDEQQSLLEQIQCDGCETWPDPDAETPNREALSLYALIYELKATEGKFTNININSLLTLVLKEKIKEENVGPHAFEQLRKIANCKTGQDMYKIADSFDASELEKLRIKAHS